MDYEKRHNEMLDAARYWHSNSEGDVPAVLEEIFPELRESEDEMDERIRKALISVLTSDFEEDTIIDGITVEEIVDWLQKEGTKKPADKVESKFHEGDWVVTELNKIDNEEINGEDYGIDGLYHAQRILEKTLGKVDGYQTDDGILDHKAAITAVKKLYGQKPTTWAKEDETKLRQVEYACMKFYGGDCSHIGWLRKLTRPQNHWTPSDEQMKALADALSLAKNCGEERAFDLRTLYEQLKKLKGE